MQAQILGLEVRDLQPSISKVRGTGLPSPPLETPHYLAKTSPLTPTNLNSSTLDNPKSEKVGTNKNNNHNTEILTFTLTSVSLQTV